MCVRQTAELHSKSHAPGTCTHHITLIHLLNRRLTRGGFQVFPDVGSNAAVISLQEGPVVEGDVKVMFESSAVSAFFYIF